MSSVAVLPMPGLSLARERVAPVRPGAPAWRLRHAHWASASLIAMLLALTIEGALRKWISPSLTGPLIGIRDLLALGFVLLAMQLGYLSPRKPLNAIMLLWICVVTLWGILQVIAGVSSPMMLAVGLRFWCLYLAFGLAVGQMMDRDGLLRFIRVCMWIVILTAPLAVFQFFSPPAAFINKQVDGDESSVFLVSMGVVRTTGTFSFTLGYTTLLALVTPLIMAAFMEHRRLGIRFPLALASLAALAIATGVSGSRAAVVAFGGFVVFGGLFAFLFGRGELKLRALWMLMSIGLLAMVLVSVLPGAVDALLSRFEQAARSEDFVARLSVMFFGEDQAYRSLSLLGQGLGAGSGLASVISTGERLFLAGEAENARVLAEGGALGVCYLGFKIMIMTFGGWVAIKESVRTNSSLPVLVWSGLFLALFTWPSIGQLTSHGMMGVYVALGVFVVRQAWFAGRFAELGVR
ncbi:hypothetical protein [Hydrogenophaga sp. 5NK40-0174]|uniref:hypothetical protein n=1 Tax=Hydrogenophaga sp. 5NK40-0174 TaxID=3127649 RepID=UPI003106BC0A